MGYKLYSLINRDRPIEIKQENFGDALHNIVWMSSFFSYRITIVKARPPVGSNRPVDIPLETELNQTKLGQ